MAAPIIVLSPEEAKGLEFDNVVVVEPTHIVASCDRGLQALFVALTRCTRRLALVHAQPLPIELGLTTTNGSLTNNGATPLTPTGAEVALVSPGAVEREVARAVASTLVRYATLCVQPELLPLVIEEMQRWSVPAPVPATS